MERQQGSACGDNDDDGIPYVCHFITKINSRGIWFGDDPFAFSVPLLMLQLSLISVFNRCIQYVLKPFGQPSIVSQILGGVILGPSVLGCSSLFSSSVFPTTGRGVFETFALFGFMLYVFLIGVKTDPSIVIKSSRRTLVIGLLGYFLPYSLANLIAFTLNHLLSLDESIAKDLYLLVSLLSMTAFPVVTCFLAELKILNSEIGRLATSSSIICDLCHWSITFLKYIIDLSTKESLKISIGSFFSISLLVTFIVFGIRPAVLWAAHQHTSEGKPVKEVYIFAILVALLTCGFFAEAIGLGAVVASLLLGLVIPDGQPLGATLVNRLDCFVSITLMPIFFTTSGLKVDVYAIQSLQNVGVIQLLVLVTFFAKFVGTILPPLFLRMPVRDALALGLIMNSKGIVELGFLNNWKIKKVLNKECYAIMIISVVIVTGVISPIVKVLYDPSRRFIAYKRRTVMHSRQNEELRMLTCIHTEDNVNPMLILLNASNPTKETPINLIVLHLVKLEGRASSLLIPHFPHEKSRRNHPTQSQRIFDAFRKFEKDNQDHVTLHCYKGVSPYATMHNDVCSLALEKRITLIIIPFHIKWYYGGKAEACHAFRHLNKNVLDKAPCSIGILINRSNQKNIYQPTSTYYRIAVLFFGGTDDREALAYAERMSHHCSVLLTVIKFSSSIMEIVGGTSRSQVLDGDMLKEFRHNAQRNKRVSYQEEEITDKADILSTFRLLEDGYDLVMVGRRHGESDFMRELTKSSDIEHGHEELGTISNTLVGTDIKTGFSVLVLQQQIKVWGLRNPEESTRLRKFLL